MNSLIAKKVKLDRVADITNFCALVATYPKDITVTARHNQFIVDAKSVMGLFSLDLSEPIEIVFETTGQLDSVKIDRDFRRWCAE